MDDLAPEFAGPSFFEELGKKMEQVAPKVLRLIGERLDGCTGFWLFAAKKLPGSLKLMCGQSIVDVASDQRTEWQIKARQQADPLTDAWVRHNMRMSDPKGAIEISQGLVVSVFGLPTAEANHAAAVLIALTVGRLSQPLPREMANDLLRHILAT
jgi:hypothetical protein